MKQNILQEIVRIKDVLPKKQSKLCDYLLRNYEQVGVMTVKELATQAEVGTTTVMRLIQTMGYAGFREFKRDLLQVSLLRNTSAYSDRKQSFRGSHPMDSGETLRTVLSDGQRVLESLCTVSNVEQFDKAVTMLLEAETIYSLGLRASKAMSLYFEYAVDRFYPHIRQLANEPDFIFDRIALYVNPTDVLMLFSVWPTAKRVIDVAGLCKKKGIPIILVTNTNVNPAIRFADAVIETNSLNHASGYLPIIAVIEAIAAELGRRTVPASTQNIESIESLLDENGLEIWEF